MQKAIRVFILGLFTLAPVLPSIANAAINLKKVNIIDGNQIELIFDGKIETSQVKTEFVRDNIQLSLQNTSVYPAKVSMVSGSDLTKVFAYQYSPALVRARFTVKGDATQYANRLALNISGKSVTLKIAPAKGDQVVTATSSALRTVTAPEKPPEVTAVSLSKETEKKELLDRISSVEREKKIESAATKINDKSSSRKEILAGGKPLPSPFRSIGVMLFVLGIFGLFILFLKRMKSGHLNARSMKTGVGGFLSKISGGGASAGMIEVIATHHLAPKRSIVVVRIQDRMLVLGMTNDSVNLITEFRAGDENGADENIGLGDFAESLKKFESDDQPSVPSVKVGSRSNLGDIAAAALGLAKPSPTSAQRATAAANAYQAVAQPSSSGETAAGSPSFSPALAAALSEPSVKPSIRAQIKNRVQGMKQL